MVAPVVPIIAAGGLLLLLFSGGGSSKRAPYTNVIPVPGNDAPWTPYDEAICLCSEAGTTESAALVLCVLRKVMPDVPWPAQPGDDDSVTRTWQAVGFRVATFITDLANGQNPCAIVDVPDGPVGPGGEEPPAPGIAPWVTGKPGGFGRIMGGGNPTRFVANAYDIPQSKTGDIRRALACIATSGFNLLFYGTPHNADEYGRGKYLNTWYDINRAWADDNFSVAEAAASGEKLKRGFGWNGGAKVSGATHYGTPFIPPITKVGGIVSCNVGSGPWDPTRNPPPEALARLGWTLAGMEAAWNERYG